MSLSILFSLRLSYTKVSKKRLVKNLFLWWHSNLSWLLSDLKLQAPEQSSWNGLLRGYYVGYKVSGSADQYLYKTIEETAVKGRKASPSESTSEGDDHQSQHSVVLSGLKPFTDYAILVQAFNSIGAGPQTDPVSITTHEDGIKSIYQVILRQRMFYLHQKNTCYKLCVSWQFRVKDLHHWDVRLHHPKFWTCLGILLRVHRSMDCSKDTRSFTGHLEVLFPLILQSMDIIIIE